MIRLVGVFLFTSALLGCEESASTSIGEKSNEEILEEMQIRFDELHRRRDLGAFHLSPEKLKILEEIRRAKIEYSEITQAYNREITEVLKERDIQVERLEKLRWSLGCQTTSESFIEEMKQLGDDYVSRAKEMNAERERILHALRGLGISEDSLISQPEREDPPPFASP